MSAEALALPDLTDAEAGALVEYERTIERGLKTFVEVGRALAAIRDGRLYRTDYATFEAYCDQRWAISRPRAYQLIEAAAIVSTTVDAGYRPPSNERQARELGRAPEDERTDVWREANERTNGRPTAATIREVVRERQPPPSTPDGSPPRSPAPDDCSPPPASASPPPAAPSSSMVGQIIDADPGIQAAEFMRRFMGALRASVDLSTFDAARVAQLADPSEIELLDRHVQSVARFADEVRRARTGLRLVKGGGTS